MTEFSEKYVNPFTDEDSLKYYRDLKNSLDTARLEEIQEGLMEGEKRGRLEGLQEGEKKGRIEGETEAKLDVIRNGLAAGLAVDVLAKLTGMTEHDIQALIRKGL